ncbi:MAG TPA: hypothetical protein VLJ21_03795 [Candidatus Binatia bacterium]|nr:hypothetical protein [Candidatus Binatia bacterium]
MKKVRTWVLRWILGIAYGLGLTLVYPIVLGAVSPVPLFLASVLILVAVAGTYRREKTLRKTLYALGTTTFIPGTIGVLVLLLGRPTLSLLLPEGITPFVDTYIAFAVPRAAILTLVYFVLGVSLRYVSRKL